MLAPCGRHRWPALRVGGTARATAGRASTLLSPALPLWGASSGQTWCASLTVCLGITLRLSCLHSTLGPPLAWRTTSTFTRASGGNTVNKFNLTILDAIADPNIFGPFMCGPSWQPWQAFFCALFALPMSEDQLA